MAGSFSGTYGALITQSVDAGVNTWLGEVNANGGINGRQVKIKKVDGKSTSDGAVAACKEAQNNGTLMTFITDTINSGNILPDCLDKASVPVILQLETSSPSKQWTRTKVIDSWADSGPTLASYVKSFLKDGDKKLGVLYIDDEKPLTEGYVAEAKALGMTVAKVTRVETNQASFTSELLALRSAGVDNVALLLGIEVLGVLRDAKALNYSPHWVGAGWAVDEFAQAAPDLMRGVSALAAETTSDTPAYAQFAALANKHGYPTASRSAMISYGGARVIGEVLKAAGRNLTRGSLLAAIKTINAFDTKILGPVTWSNGSVVGTYALWPTVCCTSENKWKGLGPARARF